MGRQIVQNDRLSESLLRTERTLEVNHKNFHTDRSVDQNRRFDTLIPQGGSKRSASPVTMWDSPIAVAIFVITAISQINTQVRKNPGRAVGDAKASTPRAHQADLGRLRVL